MQSQSETHILEHEFGFETVGLNTKGEIMERQFHSTIQFVETLVDGTILEMVKIPGGSFKMGALHGEGYTDEYPRHSVIVPEFYLGRYPVTQEQWAAVMKWEPRYRTPGAKHPVDRVSWHAAQEFCQCLSRLTGHSYRLPSEAQWEYACRAGTATPFHYGDTLTTEVANYVGEHIYREESQGIYRHGSSEVGCFPPNAFGIYDMHGNVWEWCQDYWHDNYAGAPNNGSAWLHGGSEQRTLRGGSWHEPPQNCRSAIRLKFDPNEGEDYIGFRVALDSLKQVPATSASNKGFWSRLSSLFNRQSSLIM